MLEPAGALTLGVELLEMVDRHDTEPHAELGRAGSGQLLGMKFGPHPEPPRFDQDSFRLFDVKNPRSQNTSANSASPATAGSMFCTISST